MGSIQCPECDEWFHDRRHAFGGRPIPGEVQARKHWLGRHIPSAAGERCQIASHGEVSLVTWTYGVDLVRTVPICLYCLRDRHPITLGEIEAIGREAERAVQAADDLPCPACGEPIEEHETKQAIACGASLS